MTISRVQANTMVAANRLAEPLAIAVIVSLPWSTSATSILIPLWLLALLPTLDWKSIRAEITTAAGGLPLVLWALGVLGLIWADVSVSERINGINAFHKLLVIPPLIVQFRNSDAAGRIFIAFIASCVALLAASYLVYFVPSLVRAGKSPGVPVKDYIAQSMFFAFAAFGLLVFVIEHWKRERFSNVVIGVAVLIAAFIANLVFVVTSRTALVFLPFLLAIVAFQHLGTKGRVIAGVIAIAIAGVSWSASPYLRMRITDAAIETKDYRETDAATSSGLRLEYWRKSIAFISAAPLIGHGSGSIHDQFRRAAAEGEGATASAAENPHNQVFAIGIQLGLVGIAVLLAMWAAHLWLFATSGMVATLGLVLVTQHVLASMFNSHLFDFAHGWAYVFGFGILAGLMKRERVR